MIKVGQKVKLNEKAKSYIDHETGFYVSDIDIKVMNKVECLIVTAIHSSKGKTFADVACLFHSVNRNLVCCVDYDWLSPLEETVEQNYSEDAIEIRKFIVSELGTTHNTAEMQQVYEWITGEK